MSPVLSLVTVVVLAFVLGRVLAPYTARAFGSSRVEFILLGALIGPASTPVLLDAELLVVFRPFISLLLGLLAFLVGLRLRSAAKDFETFSAGVFAALGVVVAVGAVTTGVVQYFDGGLFAGEEALVDWPFYFDGVRLWSIWISPTSLWLGLVMGAAAAVSSSSILAWAAASNYGGERSREWIDGLATASHMTGIAVFGVALAGTQANATASALGLTVTEWAVISAGAGVVCGLLFGLFIGGEADDSRVQLATLGAVTFASGVGEGLGVSPLFVNLTAGIVIGLTSSHAKRVQNSLESLRPPIVILLMLFAGAHWTMPPNWVWAMLAIYFLTRLAARRVFTRLAVDAFCSHDLPHARVGDALLAQSVLAAAIVLSFAEHSPAFASIATTVVLGGLSLAQFLAPDALRRFLVDTGGDAEPTTAAELVDHEIVGAVEADAAASLTPVTEGEKH